MKKILSAALALSMTIGSVAVHAQAPASNAGNETERAAAVGATSPAQTGAGAAPEVEGNLAGMNGVGGLSTGTKVAIGLGAVALIAAAGGGGGGSSGASGTR